MYCISLLTPLFTHTLRLSLAFSSLSHTRARSLSLFLSPPPHVGLLDSKCSADPQASFLREHSELSLSGYCPIPISGPSSSHLFVLLRQSLSLPSPPFLISSPPLLPRLYYSALSCHLTCSSYCRSLSTQQHSRALFGRSHRSTSKEQRPHSASSRLSSAIPLALANLERPFRASIAPPLARPTPRLNTVLPASEVRQSLSSQTAALHRYRN